MKSTSFVTLLLIYFMSYVAHSLSFDELEVPAYSQEALNQWLVKISPVRLICEQIVSTDNVLDHDLVEALSTKFKEPVIDTLTEQLLDTLKAMSPHVDNKMTRANIAVNSLVSFLNSSLGEVTLLSFLGDGGVQYEVPKFQSESSSLFGSLFSALNSKKLLDSQLDKLMGGATKFGTSLGVFLNDINAAMSAILAGEEASNQYNTEIIKLVTELLESKPFLAARYDFHFMIRLYSLTPFIIDSVNGCKHAFDGVSNLRQEIVRSFSSRTFNSNLPLLTDTEKAKRGEESLLLSNIGINRMLSRFDSVLSLLDSIQNVPEIVWPTLVEKFREIDTEFGRAFMAAIKFDGSRENVGELVFQKGLELMEFVGTAMGLDSSTIMSLDNPTPEVLKKLESNRISRAVTQVTRSVKYSNIQSVISALNNVDLAAAVAWKAYFSGEERPSRKDDPFLKFSATTGQVLERFERILAALDPSIRSAVVGLAASSGVELDSLSTVNSDGSVFVTKDNVLINQPAVLELWRSVSPFSFSLLGPVVQIFSDLYFASK